jgi:hypothetical protein
MFPDLASKDALTQDEWSGRVSRPPTPCTYVALTSAPRALDSLSHGKLLMPTIFPYFMRAGETNLRAHAIPRT